MHWCAVVHQTYANIVSKTHYQSEQCSPSNFTIKWNHQLFLSPMFHTACPELGCRSTSRTIGELKSKVFFGSEGKILMRNTYIKVELYLQKLLFNHTKNFNDYCIKSMNYLTLLIEAGIDGKLWIKNKLRVGWALSGCIVQETPHVLQMQYICCTYDPDGLWDLWLLSSWWLQSL